MGASNFSEKPEASGRAEELEASGWEECGTTFYCNEGRLRAALRSDCELRSEVIASCAPNGRKLGSELAQVMVEVFVHQNGPLIGCEGAEEAVGIGGAGGWAGCDEAVDHVAEAGSFDFQVTIILNDDCVDGGGVFAHRLVVAEDERLDDRAEEAADELPRRVEVAERHFDARGAVGERLCGRHATPCTRAVRLQGLEPRFDVVGYRGVEQMVHACKCTAAARLRRKDFW